jgi:hypothetical protein
MSAASVEHMRSFDDLWRGALRFRHVSRELEPLLADLHASAFSAAALERLLAFLASETGRTDANCTVTYNFLCATEEEWQSVSGELHGILDDMSGALHESIHRPDIARTFEATPEQLLDRVRAYGRNTPQA